MTRCRICSRRLTVLLSVSRGIGPICWSRLTGANQTSLHDVEAEDMSILKAVSPPGAPRRRRKIGRRVTALVTN